MCCYLHLSSTCSHLFISTELHRHVFEGQFFLQQYQKNKFLGLDQYIVLLII